MAANAMGGAYESHSSVRAWRGACAYLRAGRVHVLYRQRVVKCES